MAYKFKIQLMDLTKPPVWRKVVLSEELTLDDFHRVIQAAFGWGDYHLYRFSKEKWKSVTNYQIPSEWDYREVIDTRTVKIRDIFEAEGDKFLYLYDFGDDWFHNITLEKITDEIIIHPYCADGKGACPPEDCGGVPGYYGLLEISSNPNYPEYKEARKWLGLKKGKEWDVNLFDVNKANQRISLIPGN